MTDQTDQTQTDQTGANMADQTQTQTDRTMTRNAGNPDAVAHVPDSVIAAKLDDMRAANAEAHMVWQWDADAGKYVRR